MSAVFAQLSTYLQENQIFVVLHGLLVGWAIGVWVRATRATGRDRAWLHSGNPVGAGRLASLWSRLRDTGHTGRLELRDLYEAQAGVDSDDLARIANLFLLSGVAGTLWSLAGGARQVKPPSGQDVAVAEALIPMLRSFNAFSVTIVSVGLAFLVLVSQRVLGRSVANVAFEAAKAWEDSTAGIDRAAGELRAAVSELTASVRSLGPQGSSDWVRTEVQKIAAELGASAREASQQMTSAAGAFATKFTEAVAPLASQITGTVGPVIERLHGVTVAFETSMQALEVQRQLLEKHAAALEAIHGRLGAAEDAVQHLREVPAVVGSSLHDIGKHVASTIETLHGNFEGKLERIFKMHEGAVLTVATRMQETESQLATAVQNGTTAVQQYLLHHGKSLGEAVDGMRDHVARAAEPSVWVPVRRTVDEIVSQAQQATARVRAVENTAVHSVQQSVAALGERARVVQDDIASLTQRATAGVTTVRGSAVAAMESVQESVAALADRARAAARQLDEMRSAMAGADASRSRRRRSVAMAYWVSTGVLMVGMFVVCTLLYTRLGH